MATVKSSLQIDLTGNLSSVAKDMAAALQSAQKRATELANALGESGTTDRLQAALKRLGADIPVIKAVADEWRDYAKAQGLAARAGDWTKEQRTAVRAWESVTLSAVRSVKLEETALARAREEQAAQAARNAEIAARERVQAEAKAASEQRHIIDQLARDRRAAVEQQIREERRLAEQIKRDAEREAQERTRLTEQAIRLAEDEARAIAVSVGKEVRARQAAAEKQAAALRLQHEEALRSRQMLKGIAGGYVAHETAHFAREALGTYGEFDNERRYGKIVMGITDEQQAPLVAQALRGGSTSRFNDIQWLEAQRGLAARGLKVDQVLALTEVAARVGQAMDKSLPEGAKALEGAMFTFGKDTSTYAAAVENAGRTADLLVKGSKISGMTYEDEVELYKGGAAAFHRAGLSEENLLAFGGLGKKANMGGDEMGTAAKALAANLMNPTSGARTALMAADIDYSKYQKLAPRPMVAGQFAKDVAAKYGVRLTQQAQNALQHLFNSRALVSDPAKFTPAAMSILNDVLGGKDAKSKKSIAGELRRYRDASMGGVDVERLFRDVMVAMAKHPALANALFGTKQGARISAAIGDPELFLKKLDELTNHSQGFAQQVSDARIEGFNGAVARFEGSVKTLESSLGQAFDANGKGGFLTGMADKAAAFTAALAEAPPGLKRLAVEAAAVAGIFGGMKGAEALLGGFGLKSSAIALTEAAHALEGAALKQSGGAGLAAAEEGGVGAGVKGASKLGALGTAAAVAPWATGLFVFDSAMMEAMDAYQKAHPEEFKATGRGPQGASAGGHWEYHPTHSGRVSDPGKVWVPDEQYGPFRKWVQPPGRNQGANGHWELDEKTHYEKLSFSQESLTTTTGALKTSFAELNTSVVELAAAITAVGSSGIGGGGSGGGIINASYETGDGARGAAGGTGPAGGGGRGYDGGGTFTAPASRGGDSVYGMIERAAKGNAFVESRMKAIFEGESDHRPGVYDRNMRGENSQGPFQLNKHGGLGALFQRETGLDPADPKSTQAQADWVADYIRRRRGSLAQWRGLPHGMERIRRGQVHPNDNQYNLPSGPTSNPLHFRKKAADEMEALNDMNATLGIDARGVHHAIQAVRTLRQEMAALHFDGGLATRGGGVGIGSRRSFYPVPAGRSDA